MKIERRPVHVKTTAIRSKLSDVQRREVEDLTKLFLALADLLFRPPLIVDVRVQAVPSDNATSFVAEGIDADVDPPIDAIEAHQALNNVHRLSDRLATSPFISDPLAIVRMNGLQRGNRQLFDRHPEKVEKALVGVCECAGRIADRNHSRNTVDELAELTFAFA